MSAEKGKKLEQVERDYYYKRFLRARSGKIASSNFKGIKHVLEVGSYDNAFDISRTVFEHCFDIIKSYHCINIEDCRFDHCSEIAMRLDELSKVENCQCNDCYGQLFSTGYDGGVTFQFCEFNNWCTVPEKNLYTPAIVLSSAMLEFGRTRKDGRSKSVKNCIFKGMKANKYFILKSRVVEKVDGYVLYVETCSFVNCTTTRESKKLINEYDTYFGLFNKEHTIKVTSISDCIGLDQVNQSSGHVDDVKLKTETSTGLALGAVDKGIVAGTGAGSGHV